MKQPVGWEKPVAVPTFTSDTAPIKEVIQNNFNGILADFYDIDLLVKNVNLILNNPKNYSNIRTSARKTINEIPICRFRDAENTLFNWLVFPSPSS